MSKHEQEHISNDLTLRNFVQINNLMTLNNNTGIHLIYRVQNSPGIMQLAAVIATNTGKTIKDPIGPSSFTWLLQHRDDG